jgi:anhydro-N-acetylmuramic acid kinase
MHRYIGLMSGTSVDAVDAILVMIQSEAPLRVLATHSHPVPGETRAAVEALMRPDDNELDRIGELDVAVGHLFADAALALLAHAGADARQVRAIGSHGQTVRHRPQARFPFSLQIGNPAVIAERTGIATVADFRARDIAAGGQGAPLAPAFHAWAFRSPRHARVIVNIGGIANVTVLPSDPADAVAGFDTGPGNTLLDQWIHRHRGHQHDDSGAWAAGGTLREELLAVLLADPYFHQRPPKSTGREYFNLAWLDRVVAQRFTGLSAVDVQATLTHLTARSIADAINEYAPRAEGVFVCGGGSHNRFLMETLATLLAGRRVDTTGAIGVAPDWVEACAFAWLAHQTMEGRPGNLPSVTGARHATVLGGIYPA